MRERVMVYVVTLLLVSAACQLSEREQISEPGMKLKSSASFYPVSVKELKTATRHVVYVPVYSHIALPGAEQRMLQLSATLSIRNTDLQQRIILDAIEYYNTDGTLVETYLPESYALAPMASTEVLVPQLDTRGGTGANFLVRWSAELTVSAPIIETIMAGISGNYSFAFARPGQVISQLSTTAEVDVLP